MTDTQDLSPNPFGDSITTQDIVDTLQFFDTWEERYRYIIDLGKSLPGLPENMHTDDRLVRGCQSKVWIDITDRDGCFHIAADSDAFIVKGLLGVVLAAYNRRTPEEIAAFDIEEYFQSLDLMSHLSATRGNGLKSMVNRIREAAAASH